MKITNFYPTKIPCYTQHTEYQNSSTKLWPNTDLDRLSVCLSYLRSDWVLDAYNGQESEVIDNGLFIVPLRLYGGDLSTTLSSGGEVPVISTQSSQ